MKDVVDRIDAWLEEDDAADADQTIRDARREIIGLRAKLQYASDLMVTMPIAACVHAADKIDQLTLTGEERKAIELAVKMAGDPSPITAPQVFEYAATLRGLLERTCAT